MPTPLSKQPWLKLAFLKEPHLNRVVVVRGTDQDWLVGDEAEVSEIVASVSPFHFSMNFARIQVPEDDGADILRS